MGAVAGGVGGKAAAAGGSPALPAGSGVIPQSTGRQTQPVTFAVLVFFTLAHSAGRPNRLSLVVVLRAVAFLGPIARQRCPLFFRAAVPAWLPKFSGGSAPAAAASQAALLTLIPLGERQVRLEFRGRLGANREGVAADAVTAAFASFIPSKGRGIDPALDFPRARTACAGRQSRVGRQIDGRSGTTAAVSPLSQKMQHVQVESLLISLSAQHDHSILLTDRWQQQKAGRPLEWWRCRNRGSIDSRVLSLRRPAKHRV